MIIQTHMSCFLHHILHYPDPLDLLLCILWFSFPPISKLRDDTFPFQSFPYLSTSENSPFLNQVSNLSSLGHHYFCYSITTQHCIIYPNFECAKPYKIFVYPCPNNRFQTFNRILTFPMKASLQKTYTSKVLEDWLNCIW